MLQWAVFLNHVTELKQTARGNFSWRYALSKNGNSSSALSHTFVAKTREVPSVSMNWPVLPLYSKKSGSLRGACLRACTTTAATAARTLAAGRGHCLTFPRPKMLYFTKFQLHPPIGGGSPDRGSLPRSGEFPGPGFCLCRQQKLHSFNKQVWWIGAPVHHTVYLNLSLKSLYSMKNSYNHLINVSAS